MVTSYVNEIVDNISNKFIFMAEYTMQAPSNCAARCGFC